MPKFTEGNPGKKPGTLNKSTKLVKEWFADTLHYLQENGTAKRKRADLRSWAKDNPTEFYTLASKLIPLQITGDPNNPLQHEMKVVIVKADAPIATSEEEVH